MCHDLLRNDMLLWRCFKFVNYSHSLHITVNRTSQPVCHGICNPQWTQFLHTICCAFFKFLICVQHWFNSNIILSHGLVNYKTMSVDLNCPINFPSLKFIQLTHKNESPISKKTQHQCYKGKEFNIVYGNNCCLLWQSYKTQNTLGRKTQCPLMLNLVVHKATTMIWSTDIAN